MSLLKPGKYELIRKMLDYSALRQKALANNIANVNTPGYKRFDVEFDRELKSVLASKNETELRDLGFKIVKTDDTQIITNKNNVDIDMEMAKLSENALLFNIYATLLRRKFQGIKQMIKGK